MKTLFANMANDPNSRIVLNGCLTASQQVQGPLDPDPDKAAKQVAAAVKAQPSLVNYLRDSAKTAGSNAKVMGANASFDQVALQDASGNLDIVARSGGSPTRSSLRRSWTTSGPERNPLASCGQCWRCGPQDRLATPPTRTAADTVHHRVTDRGRLQEVESAGHPDPAQGGGRRHRQRRADAAAGRRSRRARRHERGLVLGVQARTPRFRTGSWDDLHRHEGRHRLRGLRRHTDDATKPGCSRTTPKRPIS